MKKGAVNFIALLLAGGMPFVAIAGQGVKIGPATRFESSVSAGYLYTDNFYRVNDDEVDANGFLLNPALGIIYAPTDGQYRLTYSGELGEFDTSSKDDYFDHQIALNSAFRPFNRHAFNIDLAYQMDHDAFGTVRTSGQNRTDDRDLDEWDALSANLKYTFGAPEARLNWYIRGSHNDRDYTTNEFDPVNPATGTRFLDREEQGVGTGITYKLTPKSRLLLDVEHTDIDYEVDLTPSLDGTLEKALVGIKWLATGKTTGEVWIGRFEREFDDPGRNSGSGSSWRAKITWSPKTYSRISLNTGQSILPAILFGENFIDRQEATLRWDYSWSTRFSSYARYRFANDDYVGSLREDDINEYSIGSGFELSKFYSVSLALRGLDRDSNNDTFDFDRTNIHLSFNAVF